MVVELGSRRGGVAYEDHANHLYSVAAITNASGTVVERYGYDAYGDQIILNAAGTTELAESAYGQPFGFTGRRFDGETGLWYFRARYFDSDLGRFVGRDPLRYVDGLSLYMAWFIPNYLDPFGECALVAEYDGNTDCGAIKIAVRKCAGNAFSSVRYYPEVSVMYTPDKDKCPCPCGEISHDWSHDGKTTHDGDQNWLGDGWAPETPPYTEHSGYYSRYHRDENWWGNGPLRRVPLCGAEGCTPNLHQDHYAEGGKVTVTVVTYCKEKEVARNEITLKYDGEHNALMPEVPQPPGPK